MPKLQQLKNSQYLITVDQKLVKAKQWKKGQELIWVINRNGTLELQEK